MDLIADLLRASLLEKLGDDAGRADKLRAGAAALAARLVGEDRALTPSAVLAAAEPGDSKQSMLEVAYEILVGQWETLANAYPERPVELLRAVLLAGVAEAAGNNTDVRAAGWYTLRSALEQGAGGRWTACLATLLREWHAGVETEINLIWRPAPASSALRMPSVTDPGAFTMKSRDEIINRAQTVQAAAGWQAFSTELQSSYTQDVTRLIELAEGAGSVASKRAFDEIKKALSDLGTKLREAFELHERGLEAIRLRTQLLWWQQSRYSPALESGYAELDTPAEVTVAAALDLHGFVPKVAPVAAEHVLAGLVRSVTSTEKVSVAQLQAARGADRLPAVTSGTAPVTLLSAVKATDADATVPGLNLAEEVAADRAAVLLFRDLQAAAAVSSDP